MKRVKYLLFSPLHLLFVTENQKHPVFTPVKLQKRCVQLTRKEKDFVHAQAGKMSDYSIKELFLCHAQGTIFSKPGSVTYAVYH